MISLFKRLFGISDFDPKTYLPPAGIPDPDSQRTLVLYQFATCPFCVRVRRVIDELGVDVEIKNTRGDKAASDYLWEKTQRTQVPCLFIDDVPFHESADINKWLFSYAQRGGNTT